MRTWVIAGVGILVFLVVLESPTSRDSDPEARLGMLLFGPLIGVLIAAVGLYVFDLLTSQQTRNDAMNSFRLRSIGILLDTLFSVSALVFFAFLLLSWIGFGPDRSSIFIFIPGFWVVLWLLRAVLKI